MPYSLWSALFMPPVSFCGSAWFRSGMVRFGRVLFAQCAQVFNQLQDVEQEEDERNQTSDAVEQGDADAVYGILQAAP